MLHNACGVPGRMHQPATIRPEVSLCLAGRRTAVEIGYDGRDVAIEEDDVFRITIPYKPTILLVGGINGTINGTIKLVYDAIIENAGASGPKLSELTGVSLRTLKRHVAELVKAISLCVYVPP